MRYWSAAGWLCPVLLPLVVAGQLANDPRAIPLTGRPPVVFLNGYESDCGGGSFPRAFGIADQVLETHGRVSLFFNNCSIPGRPSIEMLGAAFASFLSSLRFTDGQ